jgi:Low-density lipoprotein receptor domain class A
LNGIARISGGAVFFSVRVLRMLVRALRWEGAGISPSKPGCRNSWQLVNRLSPGVRASLWGRASVLGRGFLLSSGGLLCCAVFGCGDDAEPAAEVDPCVAWAEARRQCGVPASSCKTEVQRCSARCFNGASCEAQSSPNVDLSLSICLLGCDHFECTSGGSVPATWRCDKEVDCKDGSDEVGCER